MPSKMEMIKTVNTYYKRIIELILELHNEDLSSAIPGHCMKITGLGSNELEFLWDNIHEKHPSIDTFIVSENINSSHKYISATKLVEYRNKQNAPLLVLIPSNSRTAAEDSYGNATFKEISLEGIEHKLKLELKSRIPDEYAFLIKNEILKYLEFTSIGTVSIIKYLLALEENGYSKEAIGNNLYLLNLLPDEKLVLDAEKIRSRLNFNLESTLLLSSFNKPLYDRIAELPLEPNTLQKDLVSFIKKENEARNIDEICRLINESYPNLNFGNWKIPDLDFSHIKLHVEEIKSNNFKVEDGRKVIYVEENRTAKVKIRISTIPSPRERSDLRYFRVILMAVDGGEGEEVSVLRKLKNSSSNRPYRDATIDLDSNMIEEGSYFFKVLAEDEHGNILNANDDFKDVKIQKAFEEELKLDENYSKNNFSYKLTCDSEDFDYVVEEAAERIDNQRKDKLNNVLQAFFKYRIEKIKSDEENDMPIPSENSNLWLNDIAKHTSTFHINYSERHNYQINLSSKLRKIENIFLENSSSFGYVKGELKNSAAAVGFDSIKFVESELTSIIPNPVLKLRREIFKLIRESNESNDGVIETTDLFNHYEVIKDYIKKLSGWTSELRNQVSNEELNSEEKSKIQYFLTELQFLDVARIKTKLPNGDDTEALLLSPLHPLRLS